MGKTSSLGALLPMSQILKKDDPQVAAVAKLVSDGRGREGSSLLAPEDLEQQLDNSLKWMRGTRTVYDEAGPVDVPRFGLISLILQQTPVFVYGHPALKQICKTAFTDGMHIFVSDDLMDKLNDDVDANPSTWGLEWVMLHEIMHKLFNHTRRLSLFPPDIRNMATDLSINTRLVEGFADMTPCRSLTETGLGFKPGDKDRWIHLSEEVIAQELMLQRGLNKQRTVEAPPDQGKKGQKQPQPGQGQGQGQPQPGQGQPGQGQPQRGQGQGQPSQNDPLSQAGPPQPGQGQPDGQGGQQGPFDPNAQPGGAGGKPSQEQGGDQQGAPAENFGEEGDNHIVDPADLIRTLEENGLEAVRDRLGLPSSDDLESLGEMQESARMKQHEAIMQAQSDMLKHGSKYPGGHIVKAAGEMVKNFGKPKITWKLPLQDLVLGYSPRSRASMEEPTDLRYVPSMIDVLGMEPYLPSLMPHKSEEVVLFLIDTSGSMSQDALRAALTEALELATAANNMGDAAAEVLIWPCDTMLRGEPIELHQGNVEDYITGGFDMKGRGGTSIDTCINQALQCPLLEGRNIRSLIYVSDLYDNPVPKPSMLEEYPDLRVLFLADSETPPSAVETFAKGTLWADVVAIEPELTVDLEETGMEAKATSPTLRKRRKMA